MKVQRTVTIFVALAVFLGLPSVLAAKGKKTDKVKDAIEVMDDIMSIPEKGIPPALLRDAYGIAIIPGVIKAGLILGGRHGSGILVVREGADWSNPSFITFSGGSIGWQIGVQSADVILVFKSRKSIDKIMEGKFTLGADASIAAGPVGRHVEAGTDVKLKAEIYSYSRSRGLFAGIALEGSALLIDDDANAAFYGGEDVDADDIFQGRVESPPVVKDLKRVLEKYTSEK